MINDDVIIYVLNIQSQSHNKINEGSQEGKSSFLFR